MSIKLVEFTGQDGAKVWINPNHVVTVSPMENGGGTFIELPGQDHYEIVREKIEDVLSRLRGWAP